METRTAATPRSHELPRNLRRRAAFGSVAGTSLEFYDFTIYGLAAALVFGPVFFPESSTTFALLASLATFGVGFLARPLGGVIFGHLGDRFGRKRILSLTLIIMGSATVAIGLIPGHATIGYWAPALLVAFRLIQGLAYGGEWGGAVLMASESAPENKRGLYSSLPQVGVAGGILLGNSAFLIVGLLGDQAVQSWAWRIPFWLGGTLLILGVFVRSKVAESPEFERNKENDEIPKSPLREVLRKDWRMVLLAGGVQGSVAIIGYVFLTFSVSYAASIGVAGWIPLTGIMLAAVAQMIAIPIGGALTDKFGSAQVFVVGALALAALSLAFFPVMGLNNAALTLAMYVVSFGIAYSFSHGVFPALFTESFESSRGYTGISVGAQGGLIVGGITPFAATLLVDVTGNVFSVGAIACVALIVGATCAVMMRRTRSADKPSS
ncbi:MHS family MFS transporter [Mycolicibacterium goodii]|uniref:MFS transporter n=1 Tax=Mycolicibacterium goodii TaxID=134601 RepID=UPI001F035D36|nr:MFS transporter [Mycolicibacterium goodii]ULN49579.1 MHS family MFS transporter [Mycolicibacterium goodii]